MQTQAWWASVSLMLALGCSGKLNVGPMELSAGGAGSQPGTGGAGASQSGGAGGGQTGGTGGFQTGGAGGFQTGGAGGFQAGGLGEECIPGARTVEARGTAAEAEVQTLDRCDAGLSCDADRKCVPSPPCDASTARDCVVYSTGAGGTGSGGEPGLGAAAGRPANTIADEGRVRAVNADDTRLYWVDYGSRDPLGNHLQDGTLMARALSDGTTATLASGLAGPVQVGITTSHAYFAVDGGGLVGSSSKPAIFRVPLTGGTPELVQQGSGIGIDGYCFGCFTHSGGQALWYGTSTYKMSAQENAAPTALLPEPTAWLAADDTHLYYANCACFGSLDTTISRIPIDGGTPEPLLSPAYTFALKGDFLYGIESVENATGVILVRGPKTGGAWKRILALGAGGPQGSLKIVGNRYYFDARPPQQGSYTAQDFTKMNIVTGVLDSGNPPVRVLHRAATQSNLDHRWIGTEHALFWTDGNAIYSRSVE